MKTHIFGLLALALLAGTISKPQVGIVAPVNPPVGQPELTTWSVAPAWTPPAATGAPATTVAAPSTSKITTTLKVVQPIQTHQAAIQTAPSSLDR